MTVKQPVLTVNDLRVEFPRDNKLVTVVDEVNFTLHQGETLGIVGESGSGKSITCLAVMGLLPQAGKITKGEVLFNSKDNADGNRRAIDLLTLSQSQLTKYRGRQIATIFQEPMTSLNPVFTIGWQLTEAILQHQSISKAEARRRAIHLLQKVKLIDSDEHLQQKYLADLRDSSSGEENIKPPSDRDVNAVVNELKSEWLDRYPHQLSGGQLQRVTIAMALSCDPTLLIADEPTTALDVTVQAEILNLLQELRDSEGMSMIFITHDLGVIAEIADRVAVMYRGKIVEQKPVLDLFQSPGHPYTKGLLSCRPQLNSNLEKLPTVSDFMQVKEGQDGSLIITELTPPEVSQFAAPDRSPTTNIADATILSVRDLSVAFPKNKNQLFGGKDNVTIAVDNISFDVKKGRTLGLVGESGCGKSTLARTLMRLIEPRSGRIDFNGKDITAIRGNRLRSLRREMQIVFQNPFSALNPRMVVSDIIAEPLLVHGIVKDKQKRRARAAELLKEVGLSPDDDPNRYLDAYPHQMSGGQRQRVCIARALALQSDVIICDESVSALDVSVQAEVLNLLKDLQRKRQLTYIFISHDLSVVKFMSDEILVMEKGKKVEHDRAQAIYENPQQPYTQKLIASIPLGTIDRIHAQQERRS
jgi:peptide/nickel transport system ATP-binding protein